MDVCTEKGVTEPLTFETEIISTLATGENVIAKVNVKGVERSCQVPPHIFTTGEKVRVRV